MLLLENFELNPPKQHIQMPWNMNNLFALNGNNAAGFFDSIPFQKCKRNAEHIQAFEIKCINLREERYEIIKKRDYALKK